MMSTSPSRARVLSRTALARRFEPVASSGLLEQHTSARDMQHIGAVDSGKRDDKPEDTDKDLPFHRELLLDYYGICEVISYPLSLLREESDKEGEKISSLPRDLDQASNSLG